MEFEEIIGASGSAVSGLVMLIMQESIKESVKKHFSYQSKKEASKIFYVLLVLAIVIPVTWGFLAADKSHSPSHLNEQPTLQPLK